MGRIGAALLFLAIYSYLPAAFAMAPKSPQTDDERILKKIDRVVAQTKYLKSSESMPFLFEPDWWMSDRVLPDAAAPLHPRTNASACSTVDLRKDFGGVRDQGEIGWCTSYAIADLLSQKIGKKVSAMDLGLLYYQQTYFQASKPDSSKLKSWAENGAIPSFALAYAIRRGYVCTEEDIASDDEGHALPVSDLFSDLDSAPAKPEQHFDSSCHLADEMQTMFPGLDIPTIFAVVNQSGAAKKTVAWLDQLACKNRLRLPAGLTPMIERAAGPHHGAVFLAATDKNLDQGQAVFADINIDAFVPGSNSGGKTHAVLLVGRKFFDGKCQYLVRNSWGPGCSQYSRPCEDGNIWVSEEDIDNTVDEILYFAPPSPQGGRGR